MLSSQCTQRNKALIPKLLDDHGALLDGQSALVDLSTAENQLLMDDIIARTPEAVWALSYSDLGYSEGVGGSTRVRTLIADLANDHFHPRSKVEASHVVLGAGGCFALDALVEQICDPGEGILIAAPYWPGLDLSISVRKAAKTIPVQVPFDVFFDVESVKYYEEAIKSASVPVRAVLICNPHNPLGRNYPIETLQAMLDFCASKSLHLISDEVYALSQHTNSFAGVCADSGFVSALTLDTSNGGRGRVHVLYSLSKDFGCNGLRLVSRDEGPPGTLSSPGLIGNADVKSLLQGAFISQENRAVCLSGALSTFCQTSSMAALVAEKVILTKENVHQVTTRGREQLTTVYRTVSEFLLRREVPFVPAECGVYVFANLCHSSTVQAPGAEDAFRQLLKKHRVVLAAGTDYHLARPGWFRICYGCHPERLAEGLERIDRCISEFREGGETVVDY
ncbi:hypothetical protein MKZ38_000483 [Zalerion maritima]|uniref:Aminotransferase class I/classII large domain-containing protein n=1 Tax=Zalerion maritima TaxID=339359 RepID=A0AAD5RSU0_9PEZI|nr:hypothetical protein MKZ38_000483 [Zalerion maritima]